MLSAGGFALVFLTRTEGGMRGALQWACLPVGKGEMQMMPVSLCAVLGSQPGSRAT